MAFEIRPAIGDADLGSSRTRPLVDKNGNPIVVKEITNEDLNSLKGEAFAFKLPKDDFPTDEDLARIKAGCDYEKIFESLFYNSDLKKAVFVLKSYFRKDPQKNQILTVIFNAARTLFVKTVRFFLGGQVTFKFISEDLSDEKIKEIQKDLDKIVKENSYKERLTELGLSFQVFGYCTTNVWRSYEESLPIIDEVYYNQAFPKFSFRKNKFKEYSIGEYIEVKHEGSKKTALYRQRNVLVPVVTNFKITDDNKFEIIESEKRLFIEHTLWLTKGGKIDREIDINLLGPEFEQFSSDPTQETELNFIPIFQANNLKLGKKKFGDSSIKDIDSILEELQDSLTRLATQMVKHADAKLAIPSGTLPTIKDPTTGERVVDYKAMEVIFMQPDQPIPQYITNSNPQIENQFKEIEMILKLMATATESPKTFLGIDDGGGNEKVQTVKVRLAEFLRKIEDYCSTFSILNDETLMSALIMQDPERDLGEGSKIITTYREGLPKDKLEEANAHSIAFNSGLESKETAVKDWQGIEGGELIEELKKINEDEEKNMEQFNFNPLNNDS